MPKKKKTSKGALVKSFAQNINAQFLEQHGDTVKLVIGKKSGVYVLTNDDAPYYIGLASNLPSRLAGHIRDKHAGNWDRFHFFAIGKKKYLKDVETILIRVARPPGNRQKGSFGKHRNLRSILLKEILTSIRREF